MPSKRKLLLTGLLLLGSAGLAQAQMSATTVTDLDVRTGPGPQYPTVGTATRGSEASLDGCIQGSNWCRIDVNGMRGWVDAQTLSVEENGNPVVVEEHYSELGVPTVVYSETDSTTTGSVSPSPDDELIGPVEKVEVVTPPDEVHTYITKNPVKTVRLRGEVAVGATLPESVVVHRIPDYQYSYVEVNRKPVLVDPNTRRIVYVYR